jgi:alpha-glucosidase
VPLGFLDDGRAYLATIYADGRDADWQSKPDDYAIMETRVDHESVLVLNIAAGGGAAIRIRPLDGGTE